MMRCARDIIYIYGEILAMRLLRDAFCHIQTAYSICLGIDPPPSHANNALKRLQDYVCVFVVRMYGLDFEL